MGAAGALGLVVGWAPANAFDLPINGFAEAFNARSMRFGEPERLTLERCVKSDPSDAGECRYKLSDDMTVVVLSADDARGVKAILLKWINPPLVTATVTWPQNRFMEICSPNASWSERGEISLATVHLLGQKSTTVVQRELQGTRYVLKYDPTLGFSTYIFNDAIK